MEWDLIMKSGGLKRVSTKERGSSSAFGVKVPSLKYRQTDFAGKQLRYDGKENGHDEEDVRGADLSRCGQFVRPPSNLVHVKPDWENQSR